MKLSWLIRSKKFVLGCAYASLGILLTYGLIARAFPDKVQIPPADPLKPTWQQQGKIKLRTGLSQTKVLQGSDGLIYVQVDLEAPEEANKAAKERKPTDFVVVLDRSGSMGDAKKMDYAHRALESLVGQLKGDDRFALVSFDDAVETPVELSAVTSGNKEQVLATIRSIEPRGSTNLGAGLVRGIEILSAARHSGKAHRLLLISDGLANVGVTDTKELSRIAAKAVGGEYVISTIGVGLDFNENLLSAVADHGAGNYHFLENLASLDKVLADEFYGASRVYASKLKLNLKLDPSIELVEASGYPLNKEGSIVSVTPGPLYAGQTKTFFLTLRLPTDKTFSSKALGTGSLSYQVEGTDYTAKLFAEEIRVACLPVEKKPEVLGSIVPGVYDQAWTQNNFGRFLKENAEFVSKRDSGGAVGSIRAYKDKLRTAYEVAPSPKMAEQIKSLDKMEQEVNGAFAAPDSDTSLKRLGKGYQHQGIVNQRKAN